MKSKKNRKTDKKPAKRLRKSKKLEPTKALAAYNIRTSVNN